MTLIECFSGAPVDNISACLNLEPEKLIFLGNKTEMENTVQRYRDLLQQRGMNTVIELWDADTADMGSLVPTLRKLLIREDPCVVDLTNGDEPVILAVGQALAGLEKWERSHVSVQKFDSDTGKWKDYDGDGWVIPGRQVHFSIAEMIALHGGIVATHGFIPAEHHRAEELEQLWRHICRDPKGWNEAIGLLVNFESRADSRTQVFLYLPYVAAGIRNFEEKLPKMRAVLQKLRELGALVDESNGNCLQYHYANPLLRHCTLREGNVLEMLTLLHARELEEDGQPFFQDLLPGVLVDWDGVPHLEEDDWTVDVENEVDMIAVRNGIPLFVSCKNGEVKEEEFYKLTTVARRFGGPYARCMLIATDCKKVGVSLEALKERATAMGIYLVPKAANFRAEQWKHAFRRAMGM